MILIFWLIDSLVSLCLNFIFWIGLFLKEKDMCLNLSFILRYIIDGIKMYSCKLRD